MSLKLFAVYLGGRAPGCTTELHDVVFATGETIEATYEQLIDKWFGMSKGLHLDSWLEVDIADGHKIILSDKKSEAADKLYFINVGTYQDGMFAELHATALVVADSLPAAKKRGKALLDKDFSGPVHTDDLCEIDDCLPIENIGPYYVHLEKTDEVTKIKPVNGLHLIPKSIVENHMQRKAAAA